MKNNNKEISWNDRSPEERANIELNRSLASYSYPFSGKNAAARRRLHSGFNAMTSRWAKLGMR